MSIYNENLYENIINSEGSIAKSIRVISGYASAKFLEKVLKDLPTIELELYIGMSQQGIIESEHNKFKLIVNTNPKVSIYYQFKGPLNHMKILELTFLESKSKRVYLGSANFTENGYGNNLEIMASVNMDINYLIEEQCANSISCLSKDVSEFIPIVLGDEASIEECPSLDSKQLEESKIGFNSLTRDVMNPGFSLNKIKVNELINLFIGSNQYRYEELLIDVVLPKSKNIHWDTKGVNSYLEGRNPVIESSSGVDFEQFFPKKDFFIETGDGQIYEAKLTGKFNKQLTFEDLNIYNYLKEKLGLKEDKAISYEMLMEKEMEKVHFIKGKEQKYLMLFHKENL